MWGGFGIVEIDREEIVNRNNERRQAAVGQTTTDCSHASTFDVTTKESHWQSRRGIKEYQQHLPLSTSMTSMTDKSSSTSSSASVLMWGEGKRVNSPERTKEGGRESKEKKSEKKIREEEDEQIQCHHPIG